MNLFAEEYEKLPPGLAGYSLRLEVLDAPEFPQAFLGLVAPVTKTDGDDEVFDFTLISDVKHPWGVFCNVHGHIKGERVLNIALRRRPRADPPEELESVSKEWEGFPIGLKKAFDALGNPVAKCRATLNLFVTDAKKWKSKIRRHPRPKEIHPLKLGGQTFNLKHPEGSVEIAFFPDSAPTFGIEVVSDITLALDLQCFENACKLLWPMVEPVLLKQDAP